MRESFGPVLMLALILFGQVAAEAGALQVPDDYGTIQEAIEAAENGDLILVAPGLYLENIDFLGKAITVQSTGGPHVTVIDGSARTLGFEFGSVVIFASGEGLDSVLDGFTLTGGSGSAPGDLTHGGGVYCTFSGPTIQNNIIRQNSVMGAGGGMYLLASQGAVLVNNVLFENMAGAYAGIILLDCSNITLTHNTLSRNESFSGAGGFSNMGSILTTMTNTIVWENSDSEIEDSTGTLVVSYSIVEGGWPGLGNLNQDPMFSDPDNGDYHLQLGSAAIDAGTNDAPELPSHDFEGDLRPQCDVVDIGADETLPPPEGCAGVEFTRGDCNDDGMHDLADAIFSFGILFDMGEAASCSDACDANDDGALDVADPIYLLVYLFATGSEPPAPFPNCGGDPSLDPLGCGDFSLCP